jgi:hypothetical protein
MTHRLAASIGAAALAAVLCAPAASFADSPTTKTYTTTLTQSVPRAFDGGYSGRLMLTMTPGGIIQGWYIPDEDSTFIAVTCGSNNGKFWFDIGTRNQLHVEGNIQKDGSLIGSALPLSAEITEQPMSFSFVAKPL